MAEQGDAWTVGLADLPADASVSDLLRFALRYGILAPSPRNTQPWLFHLYDAGVDVAGDVRRRLWVSDPRGRELAISCGAVIANLTTTLLRCGYGSLVEVHPDAGEGDVYARVTPLGEADPSDDDITLFDQITRRRTTHAAFEPRPLPAVLVELLRRDAAAAGASLVTADADQATAIADLVGRADQRQRADPGFRRELADWPERDRRDGRCTGLLAAVTTHADDVPSWLAAGRALQTLLLRARAHEVWAAFVDPPTQVDDTRAELAAVLRSETPQVLLGLGYGPEPTRSPRRDLAEFVVR